MKHVPELNSPSDLCTRHRDTQEYQILRRQPPLWSRVHEGLDVRDGGVRPRRSSFGLRPAPTVIRLEDVGAGGIPTAGRPGHLSCRVGVSVGAGRKGHGSTGWCWSFALFVACGRWKEKVSSEANESPVGELGRRKTCVAVTPGMNCSKVVPCVRECLKVLLTVSASKNSPRSLEMSDHLMTEGKPRDLYKNGLLKHSDNSP